MKADNPNNRAVVTFANEKGNYMKGLARLSDSLRHNFDGDLIAFTNEASIGAPSHEYNPYAFKLYAIQAALDAGYDQILWLDCSCFAVGDLNPVFNKIYADGYIMQDAGHYVGEWTNDFTLWYFGVTRDSAMKMKCYGNAGFLGLNFKHPTALQFFQNWQYAMSDGCFKGHWHNNDKTESHDERVKGHRHDLSAGSIIANRLKMKYVPGDQWLQYAGPYDKVLNNTILIKAQGL